MLFAAPSKSEYLHYFWRNKRMIAHRAACTGSAGRSECACNAGGEVLQCYGKV